jgi:mannose-6-phosphate isomerase-like protein (cupin superfamily)
MDIRQFILPAGVGLTHVKVYQTPGPDGLVSGGAHIHLVCSEIYFVLKGTGQVELLSADGLETVDLVPNKVVFFRPGTFHRVLNPNKNLELLAIMQNGGLPERGDFVMSFPPETLANPAEYAHAVRARDIAEALQRRDLSLKGYLELKAAFGRSPEEGLAALRAFYRAARNLIAPKVDGFEWVLKVGAQTEVKASLDACDFLRAGRLDYLEHSPLQGKGAPGHATLYPLNDPARPGMCGELHPYALDESFLSEGRKVA